MVSRRSVPEVRREFSEDALRQTLALRRVLGESVANAWAALRRVPRPEPRPEPPSEGTGETTAEAEG